MGYLANLRHRMISLFRDKLLENLFFSIIVIMILTFIETFTRVFSIHFQHTSAVPLFNYN